MHLVFSVYFYINILPSVQSTFCVFLYVFSLKIISTDQKLKSQFQSLSKLYSTLPMTYTTEKLKMAIQHILIAAQ
jgi:hypothetical protein